MSLKCVFSVGLSIFWVCCLYCVVHLVLPYLNNKTGYEIQYQYPLCCLLMSVCVHIVHNTVVYRLCVHIEVCLRQESLNFLNGAILISLFSLET